MMKKFLGLLFVSAIFTTEGMAQKGAHVRPAAFGVSFSLTDYTTAARIRSSSLSSVLNKKQTAKIREMAPGLAVTYFKGLTDNIDFASTLNGTFVSFATPENAAPSGDKFSLEADASLNLKMVSDEFLFTPYLSVGVGASSYNDKFGAFIPLGAGLKLNLFDEAAIFVNSQYRVPVIKETGNYHLFHSIGIAGVIGKKKEQTVNTTVTQ